MHRLQVLATFFFLNLSYIFPTKFIYSQDYRKSAPLDSQNQLTCEKMFWILWSFYRRDDDIVDRINSIDVSR